MGESRKEFSKSCYGKLVERAQERCLLVFNEASWQSMVGLLILVQGGRKDSGRWTT